MSLGFYSKSEAYLVSLCPDGIGRTWDWTDLGSDGHGIPSGIEVTFPWDSFWDRRDFPWDSFWDQTDMGSDVHGNPSGNDPYPLISEG